MSTETYRQQFPALANKAYFNYGGQGPMPQAALDAIIQTYQQIQSLGPFSNQTNTWMMEANQNTRASIAQELNVPAASIALTEDVSVGCNIPLWGRVWQTGERILLTDCEHPSIIAAVQEISRRFGVELDFCSLMATLNQGNPTDAIASAIQPQTRLIVISHLLWNTGQVLPLAEIVQACKTANPNVRILVDAAQSVGSIPLNLTADGVDYYAFTGHKWLCGPEGVGGLYVHPDALEDLHPTFIGWRGIVSDASGSPIGWKPDSRRYEVATSAYPLWMGLQAAIALHQTWGTPQERYQQICHLSTTLWEKLQTLPQVRTLKTTPPTSGLISFQLENQQHPQLVQFLEQQGIFIRTLKNPDCVRACVHYFTLPSELDRLIEGIQAFR
ncbi:MAG: aminotransferase class V-fold PLP-dependent enzyme [Desertifilum sp. SIO1I2]|nr:aminotransferase class V-fold PLP-dependent enzyme [Desertifilum sp. SIO1I2]